MRMKGAGKNGKGMITEPGHTVIYVGGYPAIYGVQPLYFTLRTLSSSGAPRYQQYKPIPKKTRTSAPPAYKTPRKHRNLVTLGGNPLETGRFRDEHENAEPGLLPSWNQNAAPFEWRQAEVRQQQMKRHYSDLCNYC
jgi:hypothetical protein